MRLAIKIIVVLIVIMVSVASVYFGFFYKTSEEDEANNTNGDGNGNNTVSNDTEPPLITSITGNTSGKTGKITTILVTFSDNVAVTNATIFYTSEDANETWESASILDGSFDLAIPDDSASDWWYYITVDDAAGNGPVGDPSVDGSRYYIVNVTYDIEELHHSVFVEEGSATNCKYCPNASKILDELYESNDYNFYFVTLVEDANALAADRLAEYNNIGQPTVFFDGGFKVLKGGVHTIADYETILQTSESRNIPALQAEIDVAYDNGSNALITEVHIQNYDHTRYEGTLRVYLNEIISQRWYGYDGKPFHFAFLEYLIDEDITVDPEQELVVTDTTLLADLRYTDVDPENLMVVAVVFSSESHQGYSNPPDGDPFDAYYADVVAGTLVVEGGNLPPAVGITNPKIGRFHMFGREIYATLQSKTKLFGRTMVSAEASDDSGVTKVEFYIDNELVAEFDAPPYEWLWTGPSFGQHTIKVIAYDEQGKSSTATLDVSTLIFLP
jgi:glutaredoxin